VDKKHFEWSSVTIASRPQKLMRARLSQKALAIPGALLELHALSAMLNFFQIRFGSA
jgi:hypothetical protein